MTRLLIYSMFFCIRAHSLAHTTTAARRIYPVNNKSFNQLKIPFLIVQTIYPAYTQPILNSAKTKTKTESLTEARKSPITLSENRGIEPIPPLLAPHSLHQTSSCCWSTDYGYPRARYDQTSCRYGSSSRTSRTRGHHHVRAGFAVPSPTHCAAPPTYPAGSRGSNIGDLGNSVGDTGCQSFLPAQHIAYPSGITQCAESFLHGIADTPGNIGNRTALLKVVDWVGKGKANRGEGK